MVSRKHGRTSVRAEEAVQPPREIIQIDHSEPTEESPGYITLAGDQKQRIEQARAIVAEYFSVPIDKVTDKFVIPPCDWDQLGMSVAIYCGLTVRLHPGITFGEMIGVR